MSLKGIAIAGLFLAVFLGPAEAQAPRFVGSNVCQNCHGNLFREFYRNPHFKSLVAGTAKPENTGCEGCHGAGGNHVDNDGGRETIPNAFSLLAPNKILDTCLRCHSQTLSRANIRRSTHTQQDVVCTNCHSIHNSKSPKNLLATNKQLDLCYQCHSQVKAQFAMPFKHRVNEGFMQCTDCHNPHGTFAPTTRMAARPRMVDQAEGNEQPCLKCHTDKRGPFVYEHAAVRVEGCETCHNPHGSMNAKLMKRPVVATLCLECHNGLADFGRSSQGIPRQSSSHNMAEPRYQNCTSCHVRLHGSNTDARFFR